MERQLEPRQRLAPGQLERIVERQLERVVERHRPRRQPGGQLERFVVGQAGVVSMPAVGDRPVVTERLPADARAPGRARRVVERLCAAARPDVAEQVKLLVSELVTNSVRHAGMVPTEAVEVSAAFAGGAIRVEVRDPGPGFDLPPAAQPEDIRGRGLVLVEGLADRWGIARGERTTVWFEIDAA